MATDFTAPLGATTTSTLTLPFRPISRAISGYAGSTRFTTLRNAFRNDLSICPAGNHNRCKVENKRQHGDDSPSRGWHVFENKGALMFAKDHFGNLSRIALCF